jgi:hypothetical protein
LLTGGHSPSYRLVRTSLKLKKEYPGIFPAHVEMEKSLDFNTLNKLVISAVSSLPLNKKEYTNLAAKKVILKMKLQV